MSSTPTVTHHAHNYLKILQENILVDISKGGGAIALLSDLGVSKDFDGLFPVDHSSKKWSICWSAPEIVRNPSLWSKPDAMYSDIWSFGCTVLEVCCSGYL
jgi:serine/threonine protein kinase